jgi:hypothetical protein
MARVAVTINDPQGTAATPTRTSADATNDHYIDCSAIPLEELVIEFRNTNGSDRVATIVAGDNPPADAAGLGNLDITVPATSGDKVVAGLESARFIQSDGLVHIDLAASFAGDITVFRVR